jgi:hypothetical protein
VLEQVAPYWPAAVGIAALVAIVAAVSRGILILYRKMRGRTVARRTTRILETVTPLLDERFQVVDTAILNLRLELGETKQVVDDIEAVVSNGLQDDVKQIREQQAHVVDRIDRIYDHLVGD